MSNKIFWVYKLKNGNFYKHHGQGSWSVSLNGVSAKAVQTSDLSKAAQFKEPFDEPPYDLRCMRDGKWVQAQVEYSLVSDQKE